ncbi:hypothetical protein JO379_003562 [Streptomyces syringium]|uniref:Uncharacterized protein n=1 Tax=Streptomyces syringium TaxID=76729 RepID=A0ABS4Y5P7_9ACTN|nr:hypothetical protein [Streptomyces syringium]
MGSRLLRAAHALTRQHENHGDDGDDGISKNGAGDQ